MEESSFFDETETVSEMHVCDIIRLAACLTFSEKVEGRVIDDVCEESHPDRWKYEYEKLPMTTVDPAVYHKYTVPVLVTRLGTTMAFAYCKASPQKPVYVKKELTVFSFYDDSCLDHFLFFLHLRNNIGNSTSAFVNSEIYCNEDNEERRIEELRDTPLPEDFYDRVYAVRYRNYYEMNVHTRLFLPSGAQLQEGKYTIDSVVGNGGFGIVYKAHTDKGYVAIKELFMESINYRDERGNVHVEANPDSEDTFRCATNKFVGESKKMLRCCHSAVITVLDSFSEHNTQYYVMEMVEGKSLEALLQTGGPLKEERAITYMLPIAKAVQNMHIHRTLHLDIKLENILLRNQHQPVLIDFGAAKEYNREYIARSGNPLVISLRYACQDLYEPRINNTYGNFVFRPKTDVYSLGVCLFRLLTGTFPPANITEETKRKYHLSFPVYSIIRNALSLRTRPRYMTMEPMIKDLEEYLKVCKDRYMLELKYGR